MSALADDLARDLDAEVFYPEPTRAELLERADVHEAFARKVEAQSGACEFTMRIMRGVEDLRRRADAMLDPTLNQKEEE